MTYKDMKNCLLSVLLLVFGLNTGLPWADTGIDGVKTALQPDNYNIVQNGRAIYQTQCAACHGMELQGQSNWQQPDATGRLPAPPHDKTGHTWHHSDDLLFEITKYGPAAAAEMPKYQSNMPAYEKILSDDDIVAVLSFIKSTWPKQEREWQDGLNSNLDKDTGLGGLSKGLFAQLTNNSEKKHSDTKKHSDKPRIKIIKPTAFVNEFAVALSSGDAEKIATMMADNAIIFEEGSAEKSFAEYQLSHLPQDMKFMAGVTHTIKDQQVTQQQGLAVVMTQYELKGKPEDSKVHLGLAETMVLQETDAGWKIIHIHWSSKIL